MTPRNPKQDGSPIFDCKPQHGPCPLECNQCFYNRPGAFYVHPEQVVMPTLEEVGDGIVRVNSGHDSNCQKELVLLATKAYPRKFYNTAINLLDFPAPVVFTANRQEEKPVTAPPGTIPPGLMFVRLRVSATNLQHVERGVDLWTAAGVPVVLTFMAYYTAEPRPVDIPELDGKPQYEWKVRHVNSYWCATREFMQYVLQRMQARPFGELVTMCGTLDSNKCKDCMNCERYYLPAAERLAAAVATNKGGRGK